MKVLIVVGTRPNFVKITQFKKIASERKNVEVKIVHSAQHYDEGMSKVFFEEFDLKIDKVLDTDRSSILSHLASTITCLEEYINKEFYPDVILVPGDVNTTLSSGVVANKLGIKLGHIESGLRSYDRKMPEEINRVLVDELSDYFFVTEKSGVENLLKEGKEEKKIHLVGNTMIDTLECFKSRIDESDILSKIGVSRQFALLTFHRPSNVDNREDLLKILNVILFVAKRLQVIFVLHPRTIKSLKNHGLYEKATSIKDVFPVAPLGYYDFQKLIKDARFILTDSGGIQEESTYRKTPCLTFRENTERPITIEVGSNKLVGTDFDKVKRSIDDILSMDVIESEVPFLWDGKSTNRILDIILEGK